MHDITRHYESLLAERYVWLMGGMEANLERYATFFKELEIRPKSSGNAVDLGAGVGFQSIPLARLGFTVTAIDLSSTLLQTLSSHAGSLPIKTVCDDMLRFGQYCPNNLELAVCMGDTLPHLPKREDVLALVEQVGNRLEQNGVFICMFRDLNKPHTGLDRFINVRSDATRIFTCFLEYAPDRVMVHDLVHEKENGHWVLHKGAYPKLRLDPAWVAKALVKAGMRVVKNFEQSGMVVLVAQKS